MFLWLVAFLRFILKHFWRGKLLQWHISEIWAGKYCSTYKRARKRLSRIVAKHKGTILKYVLHTIIYSTQFSRLCTKIKCSIAYKLAAFVKTPAILKFRVPLGWVRTQLRRTILKPKVCSTYWV